MRGQPQLKKENNPQNPYRKALLCNRTLSMKNEDKDVAVPSTMSLGLNQAYSILT